MSDLSDKPQFVMLVCHARGAGASKHLFACTGLHYPYTATPPATYYQESEHYLGTIERERYKLHVFFSKRDAASVTRTLKENVRAVVERCEPPRGGHIAAMIDYQCKLHAKAQELERMRNELSNEQA